MYIDCESWVYSSSSAVKQTSETLRKKLIRYLRFISVDFTVVIIVSKWLALVWRKTDFGQSVWPAGDQLTTAFRILNCLEYEFLKGFLVQERQQSFWKFSILSNILDLIDTQKPSKCGKNISDTLGYRLVCHFFGRHLWSITEQTHGDMESIC